MEEKDLVRKIVQLKDIKPNDQWVVSCRSRLAFRIEMERKKALLNKDFFALGEIFSFWKDYNPGRAFKAVYAIAIVFALIVSGSGLTVFAAMNSLPGSNLYQIKLAIEKARVMIATSGDNKVQLQSEMTNRRLAELKKIVEASGPSEQKKGRVEQAVSQVQQQLADFKEQLPKSNDNETEKIVATAKILNEKAGQVEKALVEAGKTLSGEGGQNLSDKISEAVETADKTGIEALEIIIAQEQLDNASREEIAIKVGEIISDIKERLASIEAKLVALNAFKASSTIRAVLIKDQTDKASELLEQAEQNMEEGKIVAAIENIKTAKEIIRSTERIVEISLGSVIGSDSSGDNEAAASSTTVVK